MSILDSNVILGGFHWINNINGITMRMWPGHISKCMLAWHGIKLLVTYLRDLLWCHARARWGFSLHKQRKRLKVFVFRWINADDQETYQSACLLWYGIKLLVTYLCDMLWCHVQDGDFHCIKNTNVKKSYSVSMKQCGLDRETYPSAYLLWYQVACHIFAPPPARCALYIYKELIILQTERCVSSRDAILMKTIVMLNKVYPLKYLVLFILNTFFWCFHSKYKRQSLTSRRNQ